MEELPKVPFDERSHEKTGMKRSFVGAKAVGTRKRTRSGNREVELEVSTEQGQQETSITAPVTEKSIPELRGIQSFPNVHLFIKELFSFPPKYYHWQAD